MSETACFRCEWEGRARARTCPSCGAPLHRQDRSDVVRAPDAFDLDEARVGEAASRRPGVRGRSVAIAVAVAIATVGSIQLFAAAPETARTRHARTSFDPTGRST
jgi:methenyltetrahydromethanopterin cyclohydrolase